LKPNKRFRKRIVKLKAARKGLAIFLLLAIAITLPVTSYTYGTASYSEAVPIKFLPSAETPKLNLSYTSRTKLIDTPVKSGDTISGDHVILKAEWTPSLVNRSRLEIFAPSIPNLLVLEDEESSLEIDTRALGNNATCIINSTAWLTNGSVIMFEFPDVYIGNYFMPKVNVLSPNGGEIWTDIHNITWSASDSNIDDTLLFDVLYSSNSGQSFETLVSSTNLTWFEWNCTGLEGLDTYLVKIKVTDGIYFTADQSDETFIAGTIIPTSTSTTPTTSPTTTPTTTPEPKLDPRIIAFVAILLFSSGVMALVVYYAARKWF
jgi:hypothetical protein